MTTSDSRQQLHQQIDRLPPDQLSLVATFLEFLQFQASNATHTEKPSQEKMSQHSTTPDEQPTLTGSTAADLLKFAGTWQGNDFEACLQAVYDARLPAEF